ncbi:unnamed protein product [Rotaria socialis]|uniref:Uncharacterized protein n=1 Tax=Rotaria socialis TaxID=392032 RepID=A0A817N936_9BILA|nr:unnamed protein product [Rotaria socialis]CAF3246380.1 unnamed protein product [Rotaria socialis]CAF3444443.1 unnamed protein product [Rotaria socialis]CAF3615825.1 unnamed protein product [Rotaria socialis]CAF4137736.1 unnamed protein product [Rotaria socialis]
MPSKSRKVTYQHSTDQNTDYLIPLKSDCNSLIPTKLKLPENTVSAAPPRPNGFFTSMYFPISLVIYIIIPITQLVVGFIYVGQCPVQQMIVVWMVVSGFFGISLAVIGMIIHIQSRKQSLALSPYDNYQLYPLIIRVLIPAFILILLFIIIWFFVGQVLIFEVKLRVEFFDPSLPEYCHANLYKTAYILIFIDYLIFLLVIILNVLSYVAPPGESDSSKSHEKSKIQLIN